MCWLLQLLEIQSSAQDAGHRGQASANKGKTRTHTLTHAHKAITNTPPALTLSRVLCSLCLSACLLRPTRCTRAPRIPLQAQSAPKTHTRAQPMCTDQLQALTDRALSGRANCHTACSAIEPIRNLLLLFNLRVFIKD